MPTRIQISEKALADVESVLRWFQEQSASVAGQRWFTSLWKALDTLETRPERCSFADESAAVGREIRELLFGKRRGQYRILFQIDRKTVHILRIWHTARDRFGGDDL